MGCIQGLESLISISANEDNFYALASTLQSLYICLCDKSSPREEDNYLRLMAYLLENYLDTAKQLSLRSHLAEMIGGQIEEDCAGRYFRQRCGYVGILNLLQWHHDLTGKWLILTNVDYDRQKFKLKQV